MPRYFFNLYDGGMYPDEVGLDCDNEAAMRLEAIRSLPAVARNEIPKDGDKQGYMILVMDEAGTPVYSASVSYVGVWLRNGSPPPG